MKKVIVIYIFCNFFVLFFVPNVFAASVEVVGRISSNTIESVGSNVIFKDSSTKKVVNQTMVDPSGIYSIAVPKGTYDIVIVPPAQSHIPQVTKTNQTINANSEVNVSLPNIATNQSTNNYTSVILLIGVIAAIAIVGYFVR